MSHVHLPPVEQTELARDLFMEHTNESTQVEWYTGEGELKLRSGEEIRREEGRGNEGRGKEMR